MPTEEPTAPRNLDEAAAWLRKSFRSEAAADTQITYRFDLHGPEGGQLDLHIDHGRLDLPRALPTPPDVTFRLSADDFFAVLAGRENPDLLFMDDRLVVDGPLSLALDLRKLFNAPI